MVALRKAPNIQEGGGAFGKIYTPVLFTCKSECNCHLRRSNETMSGGVSVISSSKVPTIIYKYKIHFESQLLLTTFTIKETKLEIVQNTNKYCK